MKEESSLWNCKACNHSVVHCPEGRKSETAPRTAQELNIHCTIMHRGGFWMVMSLVKDEGKRLSILCLNIFYTSIVSPQPLTLQRKPSQFIQPLQVAETL